MKNLMIAVSLLGAASAAHADGFVCQSDDGVLNVKAYNHTDANAGTRRGAVLVVSDNTVARGNKTIARFTDINSTLSTRGASYEAKVDLRFNDSSRKGELIGGTKLGQLDTITLEVGHNFSQPVENGEELPATLVLQKRNGETITIDMTCSRYLKN